MFETSDPGWKWIEDVLSVGERRFVVEKRRSAVEYKIYQVMGGGFE